MFRGGVSGGYALKAGDKEVSMQEFSDELKMRYGTLRQVMGASFTPELAKKLGVEKQVLTDLQTGLLIELEAENLGLKVPQSEILKSMRETEAFQTGGNFSKDSFKFALRQAGISEERYISSLNKEILSKLILQNFSKYLPDLEQTANLLHRLRNEKRDVTFYRFTPKINSGDISVATNKVLQDYYTQYNEQFRVPEYRKIAWVSLGKEVLAAQFSIDNAPLLETYEERKEDYRQPEKREVSQLLYENKETAEKALGLLRQGESFATVIKAHPPQNEMLSLGVITKDTLLEEARDEVFAIKADETTPVIETSFGHHIFRVESITASTITPFADVKEKLFEEWHAAQLEDAIYEITVELEDSLAAGIPLEDAAKDFSLKAHESVWVSRDGLALSGSKLQQEGLTDNIVSAGFKLEDETDSALAEEGTDYLLVSLAERKESYIPEFSEILGKVSAAWKAKATRDARHEKSITLAKAVQKDAQKLQSDMFDATRISRFKLSGELPATLAEKITELPPALRQDLFQKSEGTVSDAYVLDADKGSYVIAKVNGIQRQEMANSETSKDDIEKIIAELRQQYGENMTSLYLQYLSRKYPVEVNQQAISQLAR